MENTHLGISMSILCHCQSMQLLKGRRRSLHNGLDSIYIHRLCAFTVHVIVSFSYTFQLYFCRIIVGLCINNDNKSEISTNIYWNNFTINDLFLNSKESVALLYLISIFILLYTQTVLLMQRNNRAINNILIIT